MVHEVVDEATAGQIASLIYAMGSNAETVFESFTFSETEKRDDFQTVMAKSENYFVPKTYQKLKSELYTLRTKFHNGKQIPN